MNIQPEALLYPKHSAQALGSDYIAHVMAMTREKLHEKSDIAIQLAWRDAELRRLHEAKQELLKQLDFYGRNLLLSKTTKALTIMTAIEHDFGDRARDAIAKHGAA